MTLQDIHKEFDERFEHSDICKLYHFEHELDYSCYCNIGKIKDFYDKKITELIKECMPQEANIVQEDSACSNNEELYFYVKAYNKCRKSMIENLKARNINLD